MKRTIIYIDGYNLYYGCLKHTEHKWLDIYHLSSKYIIRAQSPDHTIIKIKFFTADIKARIASKGQDATIAQNNYHRALEKLYPDQVEIIKGYYALDEARLPKYQHPIDKNDKVPVWKLEEKQTDVNIALHAYRDAIRADCEQIVIVSNDTDLAPALGMIRNDIGDNIDIGTVIPVRKKMKDDNSRPTNAALSQLSNWTRTYILEEELKNSQLPSKIPTAKKPIIKPSYW
ncbi:FIG00581129: hypothetical protein [hydrothermal vent metagenome]|uniref:NYN domain-containing protein n=1 Tax=hydrothermal vent metagenome TaxID=652676 RepID=A0A3B0WDG0_9ZZZZ